MAKCTFSKRFDRLQFHNDLVLDKKIQAMFTNLVVPIEKWDALLANEANSTHCKFNGERLFVN